MPPPTLDDRMALHRLRLPQTEIAAFAEIVADTDRIAAAIRGSALGYADEPAVRFAPPPTTMRARTP